MNTPQAPRYSVHIQGNGSTGYARDYLRANTLAQIKEALKRFARANYAETRVVDGEVVPGAEAAVYPFDPRDNAYESWGDYPLARYVIGPRGGIHSVSS